MDLKNRRAEINSEDEDDDYIDKGFFLTNDDGNREEDKLFDFLTEKSSN